MQEIEEAREFLVIKLEDFGVAEGIADDFATEIRLAKIDVEDADGK